MASRLVLPQYPLSNTLNSYLAQHDEMKLQTIDLIQQCAAMHRTKQDHISNVKLYINESFGNIIEKLKTKQQQFINQLDNILDQNQSEQSLLSSITSIINQQKQYLSPDPIQCDIKQITEKFTQSKQQFNAYVSSLKQSMHTLKDNDRIMHMMEDIHNTIDSYSINNTSKQQKTSVTPLLHHNGYIRLQSIVKPRCNYYYKTVTKPLLPFITTINILTEYLPNKIIKTVFYYLSQQHEFDEGSYLRHGWEVCDDVLHDYPDIYVDNVKSISNQPSLILTIGLPGSGKTTWSKVRCNEGCMDTAIAADDYFDKFNNGEFTGSLLGKAHFWCKESTYTALEDGSTVIVNNTNTTLSEMYAYVAKVIFGDLPHKIVFAVMPETNVETLIKRGIHGVSARKCKDMLKRMRYWLQDGVPSVRSVLKAGEFRRARPKNVSKDVIYTGIFMDNATKNTIRRYFVAMSGKPLLSLQTDCHLTLKYQPLYQDVDRTPFGKRVKVKLIGYAKHEYIQCFLVDIIDDNVRSLCRGDPHITVSLDQSVVKPAYANHLLEHGYISPIINNFDIQNTVKYTKLYRNDDHDIRNGGLIVEGTVGGFLRDPNGGIFLQRQRHK